jgi:DNA-binding transcriptional regulator YhcF (GntR family)
MKGGITVAWHFNQHEPVFVQIANKLRGDILRGEYSSEEQFPSVRQLASIAAVNPNTMQKALSYLEEEGILYSKGTVGRFVTVDEEILSQAREKMRRELVGRILEDASFAGMDTEELIKYLKEESER